MASSPTTAQVPHGNASDHGAAGGHAGHAGAWGGKGGGGGGGWYSPAIAMRAHYNRKAATYFAAAICGIIAVFTFLHWTRRIVSRSHRVSSALTKPFVVVSRRLRNLLVRGAPGFNSSGHGLLVGLYVAINLILILTNVDKHSIAPEASRFGWVLVSNLCFVVFLALKNTPLAYLTAYSYERLNCLHQVAGCTTFLLMVLHGASYTAFFWRMDKLAVLRKPEQVAGIVAGFMFLTMVSAALLLRRYAYELFYVLHVSAFCGAIVAIGCHRRDFAKKIPVVVCLTAALFLADRLLRLARFLANGTNNTATVYPLANGGTRILLAKRPARAVPGKHCFVWIPRIRACEMHPFTIISTNRSGATEFVVKSYNGFTRALHAYAAAHPGARLWAAAEGPYGTFPDPMEYDKIILIAGGSGASYTFGLAVNMLERMDAESTKNIVFIWTAKTPENLTWFAEHLDTLRTHPNAPKVHVSLYVTRAPGSSSSDEDETTNAGGRNRFQSRTQSEPAAATAAGSGAAGLTRTTTTTTTAATAGALATDAHSDAEKEAVEEKEHAVVTHHAAVAVRPGNKGGSNAGNAGHAGNAGSTGARNVAADLEKATADADADAAAAAAAASDTNVSESLPLRHSFSSGRPDAATVIQNAVQSTASSQRVLVAACGPPALMKVVRNATAKCITSDGPGVELHCEQFGW
ncbi:Ferric reductase, NAD binding protein [Niveomyces insectorum RCEF 264]|uniref:ferric-chelate reductase (NADPH) n=1 Tax=Niveomyces insectorum RCEF 264 TaxID=1081102 RepID=A0A167YRH0_9HYPO|nr:Ferric reductase, NAD binding protein [Niveomyces insectorum RCEF 264]